MKRRHRLMLAASSLIAAAGFVVLLTSVGSSTEGLIWTTLDRTGAALGSIEHRMRERLNRPERSGRLRWFNGRRHDPVRLRDPDVVFLGAYENRLPGTSQGVVALERSLGTTFPLIHVYTAWGDKPEHRFPYALTSSIWNLGSVPVITWEPWLSVFDHARHPFLPLRDARDHHGLAAVARGDYDFYIDEWAAEAAAFRQPFFLRFAHEMNDPYRYPWGPQNNTKEEFIAAWRRIVERFERAGATNVVWVWSPHVAYEYWDLYYPGDAYVDWTATGVLNFGPIAQWSRWWTFEEIFGKKYPRLAEFGKPIMIAEFGSLAVGGDRQAWYADALGELPTRYPLLKSLLFFEVDNDQTVTYQKVDWSVQGDPAVLRAIAEALESWDPGRVKDE